MREINHLRRNIREKMRKGGFQAGKAGPFSHHPPASARISASVVESREATKDISPRPADGIIALFQFARPRAPRRPVSGLDSIC